ncbi:MAG: DUF4296 domain-containing protein [Flavobacteriaceae bacterium]|jgi:hypothetical protein
MKNSIILILFLVFSCTEIGDNKPPDNLIPPEQMSDIMMDIILMKNIKRNNYAPKEKKYLLTDQYLYDKYGIDSLQLANSQEFYTKNPKKYIPIFKQVQIKIEKIKDSVQNIMSQSED